jgi:hypothetical protein
MSYTLENFKKDYEALISRLADGGMLYFYKDEMKTCRITSFAEIEQNPIMLANYVKLDTWRYMYGVLATKYFTIIKPNVLPNANQEDKDMILFILRHLAAHAHFYKDILDKVGPIFKQEEETYKPENFNAAIQELEKEFNRLKVAGTSAATGTSDMSGGRKRSYKKKTPSKPKKATK